MGLSVVHGIVKSHGGAITVDSSPERGAVFTLYFPAIESESSPRYESANLMLTGTEHILFVDDEPFQTDIAKRMLTRLGYHLTACTSSIEALEAFRQTPEVFDLVITDMTMPRMPGDVLAKKLIAIRPDIPVIVCTGFSERINSDVADEIGIRQLIMKPVVIRDLAAIIRRVLDECSKESASSAGVDSRLH